jgi:single-stranded-DNA-specific exonuclease
MNLKPVAARQKPAAGNRDENPRQVRGFFLGINSVKKSPDKRWRLKNCDAEIIAEISKTAGISPLQARLLANRGVSTSEQALEFLSPSLSGLSDPFLMKGVAEAVERLVQAKLRSETLCIHGDYDVDGVTAVALLTDFFRALSFPVRYVIPKRLEDGYGLSSEGVDEAKRLGATVLITVDCGITSVSEAEYCRDSGIDLIITDHHTPGETVPNALAVINPLQPGCLAPFKSLAGVGIAFKLAVALRSRLRSEGFFKKLAEPNLREYLDLVALGTIADLVPLTGENRVMAFYGLKELATSRRAGIEALTRVSGVSGDISAVDVGFRLAPRLNAAGRLDDAKRGVELLLTSDPQLAGVLADELDAANRERQEIEQEILADAVERLQNDETLSGRTAIVMASEKWHPGVIGIVASRVVERCHRPTILIAMQNGEGKGSGRSIPAFHLYNALAASAEHLLKFGGHRQAAGIAILEENLSSFYDSFDRYAADNLTKEELVPELAIDAELSPLDLDDRLFTVINALKPYGMGNPEPLFLLRGVKVVSSRVIKDSHLKMTLEIAGNMVDSIGFKMAGKIPDAGFIDILFTPELNVWKGRENLQLRLRDIRNMEA